MFVEVENNAELHDDAGSIILDCADEDDGHDEVVEGAVKEKENVGESEAI